VIKIPDIILSILVTIPGIIIAITLHEYTKSLVANSLGDKGIKAQGRLAPNPLRHMDPLGGIFLVFFGYGWSNPVRLAPSSFKERKKAMLMIFIMPFLANIIAGFAFTIAFNFFDASYFNLQDSINIQTYRIIWNILRFIAIYNISFALFSIIPIYPLSGTYLLWAISPPAALKVSQHENILKMLLVFFIVMFFARNVFDPVVHTLIQVLAF